MHWYRAYGLTINSELPMSLPTGPAEEPSSSADVTIRLGKIEPPAAGTDRPRGFWLRGSPDDVCWVCKPAATFLASHGRELVVDPVPGVDPALLSQWLQCSALSLLLHQRGFFVMHASAVDMGNAAVTFVGEAGWGKSTTAAAMLRRGHRLLSDDVVAIRLDPPDCRPMVVPGMPFLKLMSDAATYLGEEPSSLAALPDEKEKRLRVSHAHEISDAPAPLKAVYVLGEGDSVQIEPLPPQAALTELMRHAFVARLTDFLNATGTAASHFTHVTQVVKTVPVCRARRPKSFEMMPKLIEAIEEHATARM